MKKLSVRIKNAIFNYINNNFYQERVQLDKYLLDISENIIKENVLNLSLDEFIDNICDNTSEFYEDLAKALINLSEKTQTTSNINIEYYLPYYYIQNTQFGINSFKGCRNKYITILNYICSLEQTSKGKFYEQFCTLFLKDIGIDVETTSYSRDGGIDIIGTINMKSTNLMSDAILKNPIFLIAQVKFRKYKLDISFIRKIIGDSLFYRFNNVDDKILIGSNPLYLMVISHKGFYSKTEEFALKNGVVLIDSIKMIDILCNINNTSNLKSIKYLLSYDAVL